MSDLLPCPFCGEPGELMGEPKSETMIYCRPYSCGGFYFMCDCGCSLGHCGEQEDLNLIFGQFVTQEEAAAAWNKRA